jgi:hypothetical protein
VTAVCLNRCPLFTRKLISSCATTYGSLRAPQPTKATSNSRNNTARTVEESSSYTKVRALCIDNHAVCAKGLRSQRTSGNATWRNPVVHKLMLAGVLNPSSWSTCQRNASPFHFRSWQLWHETKHPASSCPPVLAACVCPQIPWDVQPYIHQNPSK